MPALRINWSKEIGLGNVVSWVIALIGGVVTLCTLWFGVITRLDAQDIKLENAVHQVEAVSDDIAAVKGSVTDIRTDLGSFDRRVSLLEQKVDPGIVGDIARIWAAVGGLASAERVAGLEDRVDDAIARIDGVSRAMTDLRSQVIERLLGRGGPPDPPRAALANP
jgi:hypothetical protein